MKKAGAMIRASEVRRYSSTIYFCLFQVDLSARKGDLTKQFKKWLASHENRSRLRRCRKESRGATGRSFDRLKELAAWRLYRENKNSWTEANKFATQHRKTFKNWPEVYATCKRVKGSWPYKPGDLRPFHNAKNIRSTLANKADLFSCDDDYRHTKMKVIERLSESYYREFRKPSPGMAALHARLTALSRKR
jgi:hypothetical protein